MPAAEEMALYVATRSGCGQGEHSRGFKTRPVQSLPQGLEYWFQRRGIRAYLVRILIAGLVELDVLALAAGLEDALPALDGLFQRIGLDALRPDDQHTDEVPRSTLNDKQFGIVLAGLQRQASPIVDALYHVVAE